MTIRRQTGYCTNVHSGEDLDATLANLRQHAVAVQQELNPSEPLGIGLWLSASAAAGLQPASRLREFADWLREAKLIPFTMNGFPFGDFHKEVVKHDVYQPTWCEQTRVDYTRQLIDILHCLLPDDMDGSISTLPLQWGTPRPTSEALTRAAKQLRVIVDHLSRLESEQGRLIYLCLEPEPGCVLQRSGDLVEFFERYLFEKGSEDSIRRYLRVCHDTCHAAVMFEDQRAALSRYRHAGIRIGKVQVSSAVTLSMDDLQPEQRTEAIDQLRQFAEDRYLHQTMIQPSPTDPPVFFEDLPRALELVEDPRALGGQWRTHFHVPIHLRQFGLLQTTQAAIDACLRSVAEHSEDAVEHFEVETYAWGVLPDSLRRTRLADGIADELRWLRGRIDTIAGSPG
jgi:hypothetical protein